MKIYFMGIGGSAMGNAAILMQKLGHIPCGSDQGVYPPMSIALDQAGIRYYEGFDEENLKKERPDLVVVGNVISRGNPEIEWLLDIRAYPFISLPNLLGRELLEKRTSVVISGTHGKTTTTSIGAFLARENQVDAGYLIGGVPRDLESGSHFGDEDAPFYIEGDEYDSAFFDKRSKFILYHPNVLVINNIEFDHADIYRDLEDVQRSFRHLLRIMPRSGTVIINGEDQNILNLLPAPWTNVITVGVGSGYDLEIRDFYEDEIGSCFSLYYRGVFWDKVKWGLSGIYNARNAAMAGLATGIALFSENPSKLKLESLSRFQGVKRRQEVRYQDDNIVCIEDFGHHPTAIKGTLESLRNRYPKYMIVACFEPRSNTAVKNVFQKEFTEALGVADVILIGRVHRSNSIPEHMRLSTEDMCAQLNARGKEAVAFADNEGLLEYLEVSSNEDNLKLVCFFSNGSFDGILPRYVKSLECR